MGVLFLAAVLLVFAVVRRLLRKPKRKVGLLYPDGVGRMVGEWVVFPCSCRFHIGVQDRRLCHAHEAIFAAEARA